MVTTFITATHKSESRVLKMVLRSSYLIFGILKTQNVKNQGTQKCSPEVFITAKYSKNGGLVRYMHIPQTLYIL